VTAITKTGQVDDQTLALLVSAVRDLAQDVAAATSHEAAAP
jgi:hypothetical protein